jgi:putative transposase
MADSRRRLPHQYPEEKWLFVTWQLHGTLPRAKYPPSAKRSAGAAFVWMDRYLDTTRTSPMYLAQEAIATVVVASLRHGEELRQYDLAAYAILGNHIHVLLLPKISPPRIMQSLKGSTARQANLILGRTGETFWQSESYDHWVRNAVEWERIRAYIENNPVKAGLVRNPSDYPWSSAYIENADRSVGAADTSVRATSDSNKE